MKFKLLIFICFVSISIVSYAGDKIDTNKVHRTPTVNVVSEKLTTDSKFEFSSVSIFDKNEIINSKAIELSEVISSAPGVFIKNYGGLGGMKTISVRGTSASQTLITLDGMPLNSIQNGSFDLSGVPLGIIDNIELVRGGQSALAGSNSIGGLVNITTNIDAKKKFRFTSKYTSLNEKQASLNYNFKINNILFSALADASHSPGDYPFDFVQFGEKRKLSRKNANFENYSLSLANQFTSESISLKNNFIFESSNRGAPGAVLQGRVEAENAKLFENKVILRSSLDKLLISKNLLEFDVFYKYSNINFKDIDLPAMNSISTDNMFISNDITLLSSYSVLNEFSKCKINGGITYSHLDGDMLDPGTEGKVYRLNPNLSLSYERVVMHNSNSIQLMASLRGDFFNDSKPALSPMLGASYKFDNEDITIRSQLSYNFRMPNFNEMYYLNYGTSNLKPERSLSVSAGLVHTILNRLTYDFGVFYIETKDQIIAVPKSPISWSAENIDKVEQYGTELSVYANIKEIFVEKIGFNWTLMQALNKTRKGLYFNKILTLTPQELISGNLLFDFGVINLSMDLEYSSFRYIEPSNDKMQILLEYLILSSGISLPIEIFGFESNLRFDAKNLLDERYEIINNYPMPGRHFLLGISILK